jgi:hypothetical protein
MDVGHRMGTLLVVAAADYTRVFVVAGVLGPLGLLAVTLVAGRIAPVESRFVNARDRAT